MATEKKGFNLRSFTSFSLVFSTLVMSWSGFILYVAPPGRIANWGTWKLMLFTKTEWQALHTIFSYLFFILVIIHLFFVNWKAFLTYIKSKMKTGLNRKWELLAAIIVFAIIFIGTLKSWTPFALVMSFGEKVKESWEGEFKAPPVLHMEIYSLEKLALELDSIAPEKLIKALRDKNVIVKGPEETLKEIATENKMTPSAIYEIMTANLELAVKPSASEIPQGIGKVTVKTTAESSGKDVNELIEILKKNGIEADGSTSLRTIAEQLGLTPRDVYSLLTGKKSETPEH
jgi:hypothetical protein